MCQHTSLRKFTLSVEIQVGASFEETTPVSFQGRKTYFFPLSATLAVQSQRFSSFFCQSSCQNQLCGQQFTSMQLISRPGLRHFLYFLFAPLLHPLLIYSFFSSSFFSSSSVGQECQVRRSSQKEMTTWGHLTLASLAGTRSASSEFFLLVLIEEKEA